MARTELPPLIVPWIRLDRDAPAEEALALERAKANWCAGFCLFGGEAAQVAALTARLREAAGRPIFIASDMERGAGQQVRGLRVLPDAAIWGLGGSPVDAEAFGEITARDARSVGVDVLFAPVLDVRSEPRNPIVGNRAFGWDPDRVAALGAAFVRGALAGGCMPTGKHWPGHGATTADSHDAIPSVVDHAERLLERDFLPFAAALAAGCPAFMTAHVAYPALDPLGSIATFSRPVIDRLRDLADDPDFVVFTDALLMAGAHVPGGETQAARRSLLAGCDALLIPSEPERLAEELFADATSDLFGAAERAAHRNVALAVRTFSEPPPPLDDDHLVGVPERVADRAARLAGLRALPTIGSGETVVVLDDDDDPSRGAVIEARARKAGARVVILRVARQGPPPAVPSGLEASVVVVMASVRAWKGSSDLSPAGRETLAQIADDETPVVGMKPRIDGSTFHLPGTGPDVEAAVADRLFGE
jgi:beta-glucosidase-like glycosyl hydrolase